MFHLKIKIEQQFKIIIISPHIIMVPVIIVVTCVSYDDSSHNNHHLIHYKFSFYYDQLSIMNVCKNHS